MSTSKSPLDRAIELAGGQTALANLFEVSPQAVQQWRAKNSIPANRVIGIEAATGGRVTRRELRPDIYPDDLPPAA